MKKIVFVSIFMFAAVLASAQDPVALLKKNDAELQKELKKKSHTQQEIERIKTLSSGLFDFAKMAERSLPKKTLDTLSPALKTQFVKEFQRMIENSSVHRFKTTKFTPPDSTVYEEPKYKKDNAEVWVSIHSWSKGKDMLMVYKMDKEGSSWRVWDLVIDDLSTTRNYQDQFKSILETKPFNELIKTVKDKADEYAK
ncbi:MAG: ABC transporter substrate-binding protein [Fibromonadaceae bacterium]|jgi:phospholipid transport system substrate-binding protein|nr:ABC transporter substrate-binding protein [Fibromonadaceae bacterium]